MGAKIHEYQCKFGYHFKFENHATASKSNSYKLYKFVC